MASHRHSVLPKPPIAKEVPLARTIHSETRIDPYDWLRQREDSAVMQHLQAENAYCTAMLQPLQPLQRAIFQSLRSRVTEVDQSVPYRWQGYDYYYRWEQGSEHQVYCRRPAAGGSEQLLLDLNAMAGDDGFIELGCFEISPNGKYLAYSLDLDGDELYELYILNLDTQQLATEVRMKTSGSCAWFADDEHFAYVQLDAAYRPRHLRQGQIGKAASIDAAIYDEPDPAFFLSVHSSRSGEYLFIASTSNNISEYRIWRANDPKHSPVVVESRLAASEYDLDHQGDQLFMVTNAQGAQDFCVQVCLVTDVLANRANWQNFLAHQPGVLIDGIDCFSSFVVIAQRARLQQTLNFYDSSGTCFRSLRFPSEAYELSDADNPDYHATCYRLEYSSPTEPTRTFDYDPVYDQLQLLKTAVVPNYDPDQYETRLVWATAKDGELIPVVLAGRCQSASPISPRPCYLIGYGAYGINLPVGFSRDRVTLMDLGFWVGSAHIRGGADLGRRWYEAGKLQNKENTFNDFIACAEHLIQQGYTSPKHLVASGGSAGGLLLGTVLNRRPELFAAASAHVPFVDVLTTMLDETLPLTPLEYPEWGNPQEKDAYTTIRAYSPFDNVRKQAYPPIFVTAGLNDQRVTYWEPTKWVARLRQYTTSTHPILLRVNIDAGHQGASGRFAYLHELAEEFAFHCHQLGLTVQGVTDHPS